MSVMSPLLIIMAIVFSIQKINWKVCLLFGIIGITFFIYSFIFIWLCFKKLPPIKANVTDVSPNDTWVVGYIIAYIVPFTSVVMSTINLWISLIVAVVALGVIIAINNTSFNPVLMLAGFHCYKITLKNGISGCILLSKRKEIRNNDQIASILRVGNYLLIDNTRG